MSRDFYASKLCVTILSLLRTWLIRTVLPLKQDLACLKLTAMSVIYMFSNWVFSPTVGTDLAYLYGPAFDIGPGSLDVDDNFSVISTLQELCLRRNCRCSRLILTKQFILRISNC